MVNSNLSNELQGSCRSNSKSVFPGGNIKNILRYSIFLIPLWWFLGINFIVFHLLTLVMLIGLLMVVVKGVNRKLIIPLELLPLFMFSSIYISSIVINLGETPFIRLLATIYNLSFWVEGFILILVIYNISIKKKDVVKIAKSFMFLGTMCGLLSVVGILLWLSGHRSIAIYSPLYRFLPSGLLNSAPLIRLTLICGLVGSDWTGFGMLPRSSLFFVYPTALGMGMVITIPMTIYYFRAKSKLSKAFMPVAFQTTALLFSLSRIAVIGLLFSLILVYFILHIRKFSFLLAIHLGILLIILVLVFIPTLPKRSLNAVGAFRKGSTTTRLSLYKDTIERALKRPVLGYGFKPREAGMAIPIASHSAFVGSFYKTGIIGFMFLLMFWVMVYRTWQKQLRKIKDKSLRCLWCCLGVAFITGIIWQFTEDLDAPPIVAFLYFLVVAFIVSFRKINTLTSVIKE